MTDIDIPAKDFKVYISIFFPSVTVSIYNLKAWMSLLSYIKLGRYFLQ